MIGYAVSYRSFCVVERLAAPSCDEASFAGLGFVGSRR
jgi:hypothetical protein